MLFGVLVRTAGVFAAVDGVKQASYLILRLLYGPRGFHFPLSLDVLQTVVMLALGAILIRWPNWIVRFAWPDAPKSSN
jgi:hypothetical protein